MLANSTDTDGLVVTWSEGASRMLGWSEEDMIGQDLARLFTLEDQQVGRFHLETVDALAHGRGGGEGGWRMRKDGSRFWAVPGQDDVRSINSWTDPGL